MPTFQVELRQERVYSSIIEVEADNEDDAWEEVIELIETDSLDLAAFTCLDEEDVEIDQVKQLQEAHG